ncbi:Crp/Fnr family transcriptional regulator [Chitinophaga sp.]|uniref:Crp/Fnr family transcriptional regulator n=1 Tax=Chitinophaga sp. TaxID=1869181 RepID=UPI0031DEE4E4
MENMLLQYIRSIVQVPPAEVEKLLDIGKHVTIRKGDYFLQEGQIPRKFAFVGKGLFRYLYIDADGREYTRNFMPERSFISAYAAMVQQKPSRMFIEALENSEIMEIDYSRWQEVKKGHACWSQFVIILLQKAFVFIENRERDLLLLDAGQRYNVFREEFPGLEKRVSQQLLASYLGISPVSLSRLRKNGSY